jgi:phytoene synthase
VSEGAFEDYLEQWRVASPQRALAWLFLRRDERQRYGALAALEHEWLKAVRDMREPQVAAAKLGWWRDEMQRAAQGQARHPLTQALFADQAVRRVPLACWTAPVEAAVAALAAAPSPDFANRCRSAEPLADALAQLETRIWFGEGVAVRRASRVIALEHLMADAGALEAAAARGRSPLPMNLLARHGLTLDALGRDSPARRAALRDHLDDLADALAEAAGMSGVLTLIRDAGMQYGRDVLDRARHAEEPLSALASPAYGVRGLLKTWRAARTWRNMARSGDRS